VGGVGGKNNPLRGKSTVSFTRGAWETSLSVGRRAAGKRRRRNQRARGIEVGCKR